MHPSDKNDIMNRLNNVKNVQIDIDTIARKKWKSELAEYVYIDNSRYSAISTGKMIAYINIEFDNLSFGLVSKIEHDRKKRVTKILLKSITYNTYWKIDIKKAHIFQSKSQSVDFFRNIINNLNYKVIDDDPNKKK